MYNNIFAEIIKLTQIPKLRNFIRQNLNKLKYEYVALNTNAYYYIEKNINNIINSFTNNCEKNNDKDKNSPVLLLKFNNNPESLFWTHLSANKNCSYILLKDKYKHNIAWFNLIRHGDTEAIKTFINNIHKYTYNDIQLLSSNTADIAIDYLTNHKECINWTLLSENNNATDLLLKNLNKISLDYLTLNTSNKTLEIVKYNLHRLSESGWNYLSKNPAALDILEQHTEKIDHSFLSMNESEDIYDFIINNNLYNKIQWNYASSNPRFIEILKENKPIIQWAYISHNSAIFKQKYLF